MKHYAISNLFIIDNRELALSDANILLPMNFKNYIDNKYISMGVMPIGLDQPTYLPREAINEIETSLKVSNKVISEIIPGLTIRLKELKMQISKSGEEEVLVEIPIRYESDGIKKIVAVLHLLIAMFNYNSITVLIDELDSGIFEYLLGEILEVLEQRGKRQLIFTSHNLRDMYYRDLVLGGQDEAIYDRTNSAKIARAFRKAGE